MSLSVFAGVYEKQNLGGAASLCWVPQSSRYFRLSAADLSNNGFYHNLKSGQLFSSTNAETTLIVFANNAGGTDYTGNFLQTNNASTGGIINFNFADPGINNPFTQPVSSLLLVATHRTKETAIPFKATFLDDWNTTIDGVLGRKATRNGDPTMTWEMFPGSISYLDPNQIYLKIQQPVTAHVQDWFDYDTVITYHLFLYANGGGPQGFVARWALWVDGGVATSCVFNKMWPKVQAGADTLNMKLASNLATFKNLKISEIYYLPGEQLGPIPTGAFTDSTLDEISIVLVESA